MATERYNPREREKHWQSVWEGKGAFRRFKDVLMGFPVDRERWFAFRSERLRIAIERSVFRVNDQSVPLRVSIGVAALRDPRDDFAALLRRADHALYEAKQRLNRLLLLKTLTRKRAKRALPKLLTLIEQLHVSPLHRLAKTLTSWLAPITAMWRFSKNNGVTEGFHTKMEMMTRRAYGFRNFENYRLRVLTHCGWDGIINRV